MRDSKVQLPDSLKQASGAVTASESYAGVCGGKYDNARHLKSRILKRTRHNAQRLLITDFHEFNGGDTGCKVSERMWAYALG